MSTLRRGAVGLALASTLVAGLVPAAHADNVTLSDGVSANNNLAFGNVCRGQSSPSKDVSFMLQRLGDANNNTWASSAAVSITGAVDASVPPPPGSLTLGSAGTTTTATWAQVKNIDISAGKAGVSVTVPTGAALGPATASVTWTATGTGHQTTTVTKTTPMTVTWTTVDCTPQDTSPPAVSYVLNPAAPSGTDGWYREDVAIRWTVTDGESTAVPTGCQDQTFKADGSHTSSCSATSRGGSAGPVTASVKIDRTPPNVTPTVTGSIGDDGWYTGDVKVTWQFDDATSGVDTTSADCAGTILTSDTTGAIVTCTVIDRAGNRTSVTQEVKRDSAMPVITKSVSGTPGDAGWFVGDVSVDWTVSDATSDLAWSSGCDDVILKTDTGGTTYTCSARDRAGHAASDSVSVKRDATAPVITSQLSGTEGDNGWYRGPVVVRWDVSDTGSGVVQGCDQETITADGVHEPECAVTDVAGNRAQSPALVQIDGSAPAITPVVTGPRKGTEWFTGDVKVGWDVAEATSGVATSAGCKEVTVTADTDGTTYTCSATDLAGNSESRSVTVKRDATAPVVEPDVSGTRNGDWFTGEVSVAWKVTEVTSGITSRTGCDAVILREDTMGRTYTCSVTDAAGNAASGSTTVTRDATAPVITPQVTGPKKGTEWFTGDVSVSWTVIDPTSGVASKSGCDAASVTDDTQGTTYTCAATDVAGNGTSRSVTVERDATAPVVTPHTTGTHNGDWFTGDVAVTWTVTDATSGVGGVSGCDPVTLGTDTKGKTYTCSATDLAGNEGSGAMTAKRDTTAPVITADVRGEKKGTEWYTGDVSVTWTVEDATSGVATRSHCDAVTLAEDTDGTTYTCSAVDVAGNGTSRSVTVKRDATAPVITPQVLGIHTLDWYTGDVSVGWTVSDATSAVASRTGCDLVTLATDTSGETYTCSATDAAGNKTTESTTVKRDATAPVITVDVSGATKGTEWFTGEVKVSWTVTDATSGVASRTGCGTTTVTQDTAGTTFTCSTLDVAGNASTRSVTVKRDATAPALTLTGGPADGATYDFGDVPAPSTCAASDATSGLAGACTVTAGGTAVGTERTQAASVTDQAGNVATETRTYAVAAWRLDGFYKPVTMGTAVVNTVKAGSTVPLKFNVHKGGVAMAAGIGATFTATKVGCDTGDVEDVVDFVTTGATSLRYDSVAGQWVQNWATPSGGRGFCYRVTMKTADGSSIVADFKLK